MVAVHWFKTVTRTSSETFSFAFVQLQISSIITNIFFIGYKFQPVVRLAVGGSNK